MPKKTVAPDSGTLVDRLLNRVKNNRVMAAIIVAGIGMAAVASFTDSMKKVIDVLPSILRVEIGGEWKSEPVDLYGAGPQVMTLNLREIVGGQITGSVRFFDTQGRAATGALDILEGRREGNKVTFSFDGGWRTGPNLERVKESVYGEISKHEIRSVYQREGLGAIPFGLA